MLDHRLLSTFDRIWTTECLCLACKLSLSPLETPNVIIITHHLSWPITLRVKRLYPRIPRRAQPKRVRKTQHPRSPRAKQQRYVCRRHWWLWWLHPVHYPDLVENTELSLPEFIITYFSTHLHSLQKTLPAQYCNSSWVSQVVACVTQLNTPFHCSPIFSLNSSLKFLRGDKKRSEYSLSVEKNGLNHLNMLFEYIKWKCESESTESKAAIAEDLRSEEEPLSCSGLQPLLSRL